MRWNNDWPIITWLELAVSARWQQDSAVAVVHPASPLAEVPCYCLSLDGQWLCSGEGDLTVFDSMAAAMRFLYLLKVEKLKLGPPPDLPEHVSLQCHRLAGRTLTICKRCRPSPPMPIPDRRKEGHYAELG